MRAGKTILTTLLLSCMLTATTLCFTGCGSDSSSTTASSDSSSTSETDTSDSTESSSDTTDVSDDAEDTTSVSYTDFYTLSGTLTDSDGNSMSNATLTLISTSECLEDVEIEATTDDSGSFTFDSVPVDAYLKLSLVDADANTDTTYIYTERNADGTLSYDSEAQYINFFLSSDTTAVTASLTWDGTTISCTDAQ